MMGDLHIVIWRLVNEINKAVVFLNWMWLQQLVDNCSLDAVHADSMPAPPY